MNIVQESKPSRVIELNEIPNEIWGAKIEEHERELLSLGGYSDFKDNLYDSNTKSYKKGRFCFTKDSKSGELKAAFIFEKEKLVIPDKIKLGKKNITLKEEEIEQLKKGKFVCLQSANDQILLKVCDKTNDVVVSFGKELGIPDELAGYKLTAIDKENLANGSYIGTRLFEGEKGQCFTANIKLSSDNKSMVFSDYEEVSANIEELKKKYNFANESSITNNITVDNNNLSNQFKDLIDNKDFVGLKQLKDSGHTFTEAELSYINKNDSLTKEDVIAATTIINSTDKNIKVAKVENKLKDPVHNKNKTKVNKPSKDKMKNNVNNIVRNAFSDL